MASDKAVEDSLALRRWLLANRGAASRVAEMSGSVRGRIHNAGRGERRLTRAEADAVLALAKGELTEADLRIERGAEG